eukprot:m.86606 g.86606  ORF g.86606 m.86606 type:complete len:165 (+) comp36508_c0_seq10:2069-2563(+)
MNGIKEENKKDCSRSYSLFLGLHNTPHSSILNSHEQKGNPSAKKRRRHDSEEYFIFDEPLPFLNDNAADLTWITRNSRKKKRAKIDRWRDTSESGTEGSRGCPRDDDDESADDRDGGLPDLTSDNDDDPVVAGVCRNLSPLSLLSCLVSCAFCFFCCRLKGSSS